jgi:tetratricopeptide (TPR) repeat protein
MAEQSQPISRMVALKVIKAGMDTKQVLARFEAERQALAMMDHPNIAKVLDAGATSSGRPYFAMELVKGIPITEFCDEKGLDTKARLALFGDVCAAINHAHQKGIIHRDIKPSNVLVTLHGDKAVVKVIDFGIAKATQGKLTDQTLFTRFEQMIGTPVYMSPEQASLSGLDIDTRSDIYALGILLYELLVGKPPFDSKSLLSAGYEEMRRIIREVEPPKPSSRLSTVAGEERTALAKTHQIDEAKLHRLVEPDLDWIVMKAIEKDRSRRYETANALAEDIACFLADEPVSATPPSAGYQFRKFAKRHRATLRVGAAIAAILVAATAVSTWQAVRATAAGKDAEAVSKFLTDMFKSSRPGAEKGGREVKVADVLDQAVEDLDANKTIPPKRRAKLQATLGATYSALGLFPEAIPLQEKLRDYQVAHLGPQHPDTLWTVISLGNCYHEVGRRDEALELREEVLALSRKVLGVEHPETLSAMHNLASSYTDAGRWDEAFELREGVLELRRKVDGAEHPETIRAMANLALSYSEAGREAEALEMREEVLALNRKVLGAEHPETLRAMNNLAISYSEIGRTAEALEIQEEVLEVSSRVSGAEHPDTLIAMQGLATYLAAFGRHDEALELQEETLRLRRKVSGAEHPETFSVMHNLANYLAHAGRRDEALGIREEVLELRRKTLGAEHPETLKAMANLADSYDDTGRPAEALELNQKVVTLYQSALGSEHPQTLKAMDSLVVSYSTAGRQAEALELQEKLLGLHRKVLGPEHPETLGQMTNLALTYFTAGREDEAIALQEQALDLKRRFLQPEHPYFATALQDLAVFYTGASRFDEALELREELLALKRKNFGPKHPETLKLMVDVVRNYRALGRNAEAEKLYSELGAAGAAPPIPAMSAAENRPPDSAPPGPAKTREIEFLEDALSTTRLVNDDDHEYTLAAKAKLAAAYRANGDEAAAAKLEKEIADSKARNRASGNEP